MKTVLLIWLSLSAPGIGAVLDELVWERLKPFEQRSITDEERQKALDNLAGTRQWEQRVAEALAKLAIDSRYSGNREQLGREFQPLFEKVQGGGKYTESEKAHYIELGTLYRAELEAEGKTTPARLELAFILEALIGVGDARVVPLIGPLLAERASIIGEDSDAPMSGPQHRAANALWVLARRGLPLPGIPYSPNHIDAWRQWWVTNSHQYGPVPAPLAALEATEGGTKEPPVPESTEKPVSRPRPVATPHAPAQPIAVAPVTAPGFDPTLWIFGAVVLVALGVFEWVRRRNRVH